MKLDAGHIYIGEINKKPVKFVGITIDLECSSLNGKLSAPILLHQFEYVLKEHLPDPKKGGVAGYGQTTEQLLDEHYTVVENLDVLYGTADT